MDEEPVKILTREQCRAGRGLLDWSQSHLGSKADLSEGTVRHFEFGLRVPNADSLRSLRTSMERAGVKFIPGNGKGPGVRIAKGSGKASDHHATIPVMKAKKRVKTRGRK